MSEDRLQALYLEAARARRRRAPRGCSPSSRARPPSSPPSSSGCSLAPASAPSPIDGSRLARGGAAADGAAPERRPGARRALPDPARARAAAAWGGSSSPRRRASDFRRTVALKLIHRPGPGRGGGPALPRRGAHPRLARAPRHRALPRRRHAAPRGSGTWRSSTSTARDLLEHARAAALAVRERVELFAAVLDAVAYAHGRGVVHRDLKPSNLLVGSDGRPRLLDFGISKLVEPGADGARADAHRLAPADAGLRQPRAVPRRAGLGRLRRLLARRRALRAARRRAPLRGRRRLARRARAGRARARPRAAERRRAPRSTDARPRRAALGAARGANRSRPRPHLSQGAAAGGRPRATPTPAPSSTTCAAISPARRSRRKTGDWSAELGFRLRRHRRGLRRGGGLVLLAAAIVVGVAALRRGASGGALAGAPPSAAAAASPSIRPTRRRPRRASAGWPRRPRTSSPAVGPGLPPGARRPAGRGAHRDRPHAPGAGQRARAAGRLRGGADRERRGRGPARARLLHPRARPRARRGARASCSGTMRTSRAATLSKLGQREASLAELETARADSRAHRRPAHALSHAQRPRARAPAARRDGPRA